MEPANVAKQARGHGDVIRGEKSGNLTVPVIAGIQEIRDRMAGAGVMVIRRGIHGSTAYHVLGKTEQLCLQHAQPSPVRFTIVICERKKLTYGAICASVPCAGRTASGLTNDPDRQASDKGNDDGFQIAAVTVAYQYHFECILRVVDACQCFEAGSHLPWTIESRNDYRKDKRAHGFVSWSPLKPMQAWLIIAECATFNAPHSTRGAAEVDVYLHRSGRKRNSGQRANE